MGLISVSAQQPVDGQSPIAAADVNNQVNTIVSEFNGNIEAANVKDSTLTLAKLAAAVQAALVPAGAMTEYAGSSAPTGWLLCDGSAVSRSTYAALFAVIGTSYGVGDNSTTFNLPDMRGKTAIGLKSTDTDFDALGETGGAKTSSVAHTHTGPSHQHDTPSLFGREGTTNLAGYAENFNPFGDGTVMSGSAVKFQFGTNVGTAAVSYPLTGAAGTGNTGAMSANATPSVVQPYQVFNYIIKT